MRPKDFSINDLITDLNGTCNSIDYYLPDGMSYDDLTDEDFQAIDDELFEFDLCGWWCENSEMAEDDRSCEDCTN